MSEKSARERWLEMQYALAHRVLDDAGVPTETTVDGVPEQAVHCRIKILRARVAVLEAEVRAWRSYGEYGLSKEYHVELSEPVYDAMETTGSLAPTPESEAGDE